MLILFQGRLLLRLGQVNEGPEVAKFVFKETVPKYAAIWLGFPKISLKFERNVKGSVQKPQ